MPVVLPTSRIFHGGYALSAMYDGDHKVWEPEITTLNDPATQAFLDATGLDQSFAPALDVLVVGLKNAGLWSKMRAIYPFIGGTAELHKWNLLDPRDDVAAFRLTYSGSTSTHSTALGYRPNQHAGEVVGGGYADTHFPPAAWLAQDSTHLAFYSLADVPVTQRCDMGCFSWFSGPERFHIIARYSPSEFYFGMSESGASNVAVPASSGLFVATRTGPTAQAGYRNGVLVGSSSAPSIALPPTTVWIGGINFFGERSDLPCGFASIGTGLSAVDVADLNRVVTDYQVALGRRAVFTGFW